MVKLFKSKPMTLKEAKEHVKSLGLRLTYDREYNEYTVWVPGNPKADYFTDDREDAIATANLMAAELKGE